MMGTRRPRTLAYDPFWEHLYATTPRPLAFRATTHDDWQAWRRALKGKLEELLGLPRPKTDPNVELLATKDCGDYVREHVVYDSEPHASVTAYVLRPKGSPPPGGWPGLMVLHGHLHMGKELLAGLLPWTLNGLKLRRLMWRDHKNVAELFVRRGYVCFCPDARGWGERGDGFYRRSASDPTPPFAGRRDPCNVHFLNGQLFGVSLMGLNAWDDARGLDLLAARSDVSPQRIGAIGSSLGGTRALLLAALDERIKAADVSCYLSTFQEYGLRLKNTCGTQLVPGILQHCEMGDVAALVAPRALLVESGVHDDGFPVEAARRAFETVRRCYDVAGAPDRCEHEVFDGGHMFAAGRAFDFFDRALQNGER